jgi:hypothetical protein
MRNLILVVFGFFVMSCGSSKHLASTSDSLQKFADEVSPGFETIDPNIMKLLYVKRGYESLRRNAEDNDTTKVFDTVKIYDKKRNILKKIEMEGNSNSPIWLRQELSPYFDIYKSYYKGGNINVKVVESWLGFQIGKEYIFDNMGKLSVVKDMDKGYSFDFNDVLAFCKKNNIRLVKAYRIAVRKDLYKRSPSWFITCHYPKYPGKHKFVTITLDGKTGHIKNIKQESDIMIE